MPRYLPPISGNVLNIVGVVRHNRSPEAPRFTLSGASNIRSAALRVASRTALSFAPMYRSLSPRKAMPVTCRHLHVQRTYCSILDPFAARNERKVDSRSHQSRQTSLMVKQRLSADKTSFILSLVDAWVAIAARSHRRCSAAGTHRGEERHRSHGECARRITLSKIKDPPCIVNQTNVKRCKGPSDGKIFHTTTCGQVSRTTTQ